MNAPPTHMIKRFKYEPGQTLADAWKNYVTACYGSPNALMPMQERECQQAFYGSAAWLLGFLLAVTSDKTTEAQGVEALAKLQGEINAFSADNARKAGLLPPKAEA